MYLRVNNRPACEQWTGGLVTTGPSSHLSPIDALSRDAPPTDIPASTNDVPVVKRVGRVDLW